MTMDDNQLQTIAKLANARIDELFAGGQVRSIPQITVGMVRIVLAVEDELICASVDAVTQPQQANEGTAHTNGPPVAHPVVEQAMREIARAVERHEQRQEAGVSDNYIWQPMGPMEYVCQCPDCGVPGVRRRQIYVNTWAENYIVGICDPDNGNDNRHVVLPNDLRLCRRVPAPAPVPVDASVREAIEIVIGRSGEVGPYQQTRRTLLDACARIEDWLAGLPEQEAGHD